MSTAEPMETGLYLYGVTRTGLTGEVLPVHGVQPGSAVEFLVAGPLAAAISRVSLPDFAPERVQARLLAGETRWVEEQALSHAAVLQELMRRSPVVPARFGVLYRDPDRLAAAVATHAEELAALLDRFDRRGEWGVTVACQRAVVGDALREGDAEIRGAQEHLGRLPPGTAYLYRKRLDLLLEEKVQERLFRWSDQIHQALAGICEAAETLDAVPSGTTREGEMTALCGAYLVAEEDCRRFHQELERLARLWEPWGLRFRLSGPWPPYHFVRGPVLGP